ncbi:MmgE/PrpD family protein [Kocuria flava]|uniref:MmgE/PrpD family protein n=1 Tax=Kocuria flava TaxID=446860 RepID=UPI001FF4700D|nr:MmgE/PrpD family protein [Kocuria flava]MCJ8503998.1 MmgE/PrpD family protein [Kocuria flava]
MGGDGQLTAQATLTDTLLRHAHRVRFEDFGAAVLQRARHRVLDALGNTAAGHRAQGTDRLVETVVGWGGREDAPVLGDGRRIPAHHAAMLNAALMRSFDFEPVGAEGPGRRQVAAHLTGTTVPVALAVGEREGADGRALLTALLAGEDIAARLAFGSGFDVYSGQDNTGTVNGVGATVVACLLMGLDETRTRHAVGIAVNQLAGTVAAIFDRASAFTLPMAFAARNAITAAELAAAGVTGPEDPLGGRFGFLQTYCADPDPEVMLEHLGEEFYADAVIKPWSCCRAAHPSLDACVRLVEEGGVDPERIEKVVVHVTPRTAGGFVGQPFEPGECPEVSAAFSIRYTAAAALVFGTVRPEHLGPEAVADPRVRALLDVIEIRGSLDDREVLTAEVEVHLAGGGVARQRVDTPRGDVHHAPLSEAQILEKYRLNTAFSGRIGPARAERAAELVAHLEDLEDLGALTRCFAPER